MFLDCSRALTITVQLPALPLSYHALLPTMSNSSSCVNYGIANGTSCACPVGFGGPTCEQPACGGNIFQGSSRSLTPVTGNFPNLTAAGCSCESGWGGTGCNVCQSASACQTAFAAVISQGSSSSSAGLGLPTGQNGTLVCNSQARVYAAGQMSCQVDVSNDPVLMDALLSPHRTLLSKHCTRCPPL